MSTDKKFCRKSLTPPAQEQNNQPGTRDFVAMIPFKLKEVISGWQPEWPEILKEFPMNILFTNYGEPRGVLYEPDLQTFSDQPEKATLTYRTVTPSDFQVRVAVNKSSGEVQSQKYMDDELIFFAHGRDLREAMFVTTMNGIHPKEPASIRMWPAREQEELRSCIADHWPPPPERRVREPLVFGIIRKSQGEANLVFIPQRQARRLAAIHTAISEATTWKSFCDLMPIDDLWKVTSELHERHPLPAMTDEFDDRWLPFGYHDGDWPDWPEQLMENWLPSRICAEYGKLEGSLLNGDFLILDVTRTEEIVQELLREGFQLRHDPRLVRRACGHWVAE